MSKITATYVVQVLAGVLFVGAFTLWWSALSSGRVGLSFIHIALMGVNGLLFMAQFYIRGRLQQSPRT